jgi:hypothetical protein
VAVSTTTTRALLDNVAAASELAFGSMTYDSAGNVYLVGVNTDEAAGSRDLVYRKWTRSGASLGSEVVLDAATSEPYVSAKRGYSSGRIEWIYTDGSSSPYNVVYDSVALNSAPSAPTWATTAGAKDVAVSLVPDWNFNDADLGDTQSAYALKRDIGGTVRWWDGTDWDAVAETWVTSSTTEVTLAAGWGTAADADHNFYVATKDAAGLASGYSTALVITPSAKVNPTLDEPDHGDVVGTSTLDAEWTVAEQSAYKVRLLSAVSVELWSSGWVTDTAARVRTIGYTLANTTSYKVELTTKNADGLESTADTNDISVSYTPPATATLTVTPDAENRALVISIDNPTPSGGQPAVDHNELWRRVVGDTGDGIQLAAPDGTAVEVANDGGYTDPYVGSGADYEYRVLVVGANGTTSWSDWEGDLTEAPDGFYGGGY